MRELLLKRLVHVLLQVRGLDVLDNRGLQMVGDNSQHANDKFTLTS